jgi:hypothetical protein
VCVVVFLGVNADYTTANDGGAYKKHLVGELAQSS